MQLSTPFPGAGSHKDFDWGLRGENVRKLMSRYDAVPQLDADTSGMVGEPGQIVATQRCSAPDSSVYIPYPPNEPRFRSLLLHSGNIVLPAESSSVAQSPFQPPGFETHLFSKLHREQYARGIWDGDCASDTRCVATQTGEGVFPERWGTSNQRKAEAVRHLNGRKAPRFTPAELSNTLHGRRWSGRGANYLYDVMEEVIDSAAARAALALGSSHSRFQLAEEALQRVNRCYKTPGGEQACETLCRRAHTPGFIRHEGKYGHLPFFVVNEGTQTDPPAADKSKKRRGSAEPPDAKRLRANQAKIKPSLRKRTKRTKAKSK